MGKGDWSARAAHSDIKRYSKVEMLTFYMFLRSLWLTCRFRNLLCYDGSYVRKASKLAPAARMGIPRHRKEMLLTIISVIAVHEVVACGL